MQRAERAVFPPGEAKEDWAILRALSEHLEAKLAYDNQAALRAAMEKDAPHFAKIGETPVHSDTAASTWNGIGMQGRLDEPTPVANGIADYYLTNPIARASETMARCSQELVHGVTKMAAE